MRATLSLSSNRKTATIHLVGTTSVWNSSWEQPYWQDDPLDEGRKPFRFDALGCAQVFCDTQALGILILRRQEIQ